MSNSVIKVENLGKQYRLGEVGTGTLSHDLNRWWAKFRGKEDPFSKVGESNDRTFKGETDYVWALKNIDFEVKAGEVLGIIGRNGAGKSTLLKILSKVTKPSTGRILTKGRIASLLEVGTGFHPEMTGRENIFLNGAIMGMTKAEIRSKFDEIVEFAGVERYINTPVKRYSSGMYVRLAFAVAAHLESEILIVDEVLAVGDAEFQKKCLGKMGEVSKGQGRTVLFVSHNMGSISQLCEKVILLNNGSILKNNKTADVIDFYLRDNGSDGIFINKGRLENQNGIRSVFTLNETLEKINTFLHTNQIQIAAKIKINSWTSGIEFRIVFRDTNGKAIFTSDLPLTKTMLESSYINIFAKLPPQFLRPGTYLLTFALFVPHQYTMDLLENVLAITVVDGGSRYAASEGLDYGYIFFEPEWQIDNTHKNYLFL